VPKQSSAKAKMNKGFSFVFGDISIQLHTCIVLPWDLIKLISSYAIKERYTLHSIDTQLENNFRKDYNFSLQSLICLDDYFLVNLQYSYYCTSFFYSNYYLYPRSHWLADQTDPSSSSIGHENHIGLPNGDFFCSERRIIQWCRDSSFIFHTRSTFVDFARTFHAKKTLKEAQDHQARLLGKKDSTVAFDYDGREVFQDCKVVLVRNTETLLEDRYTGFPIRSRDLLFHWKDAGVLRIVRKKDAFDPANRVTSIHWIAPYFNCDNSESSDSKKTTTWIEEWSRSYPDVQQCTDQKCSSAGFLRHPHLFDVSLISAAVTLHYIAVITLLGLSIYTLRNEVIAFVPISAFLETFHPSCEPDQHHGLGTQGNFIGEILWMNAIPGTDRVFIVGEFFQKTRDIKRKLRNKARKKRFRAKKRQSMNGDSQPSKLSSFAVYLEDPFGQFGRKRYQTQAVEILEVEGHFEFDLISQKIVKKSFWYDPEINKEIDPVFHTDESGQSWCLRKRLVFEQVF
jgi:hypothetical protein